MLMWADVERDWGLTNPMADQEQVAKARVELRSMLVSAQKRPGGAQSELEEFRRALGPKREKAAPAPSADPQADLAEMRSAMSRGPADD